MAHYMRWHLSGDVRAEIPISPYRQDPEARFWAKVDKAGPVPLHRPELGECWVWAANKFRLGYGAFKSGGQNVGAHQWIYEHERGAVPEGLELDHKCRNRACVRLDHIEPVTHAENMHRLAELRTHCKSGRHPFTAAHVVTLSNGTRLCRTCRDERCAEWRAARKASLTTTKPRE